jgi:hypothetical protein
LFVDATVLRIDVQQPAVLVLDREAFVRGFESVVKLLLDSSKDVKERKNFDSIAKTLSDWGFHLTVRYHCGKHV